MVLALLARGPVCIGSAALPAVVLAALGIGVHAAVVLNVAGVLASLSWLASTVRWALVGVGECVKLEAVSGLIVIVDVVASQAWEGNVSDWRGGRIAL